MFTVRYDLHNEQDFSKFLEAGDADEIVKRSMEVANKSNLIYLTRR